MNEDDEFDQIEAGANEALMNRTVQHGRMTRAHSIALRAQGHFMQEQLAQQRFQMGQQRLRLEQIKQAMEMAGEVAKMQREAVVAEHAKYFFDRFNNGEIKTDDPGFMDKIIETSGNAPHFMEDEAAKKFTEGLISQHNSWKSAQLQRETLQKSQQAQSNWAYEQALQSGLGRNEAERQDREAKRNEEKIAADVPRQELDDYRSAAAEMAVVNEVERTGISVDGKPVTKEQIAVGRASAQTKLDMLEKQYSSLRALRPQTPVAEKPSMGPTIGPSGSKLVTGGIEITSPVQNTLQATPAQAAAPVQMQQPPAQVPSDNAVAAPTDAQAVADANVPPPITKFKKDDSGQWVPQ